MGAHVPNHNLKHVRVMRIFLHNWKHWKRWLPLSRSPLPLAASSPLVMNLSIGHTVIRLLWTHSTSMYSSELSELYRLIWGWQFSMVRTPKSHPFFAIFLTVTLQLTLSNRPTMLLVSKWPLCYLQCGYYIPLDDVWCFQHDIRFICLHYYIMPLDTVLLPSVRSSLRWLICQFGNLSWPYLRPRKHKITGFPSSAPPNV